MNRGKQTVKKGIWRIGGRYKKRKRKQKGGAIPCGLIASLAGPMIGEVVKLIFKKIIGGRKRRIKRW